MDNYSIEEVKNIIDNDNLSFYILRSILDNATRRIEIYGDEECIEILKYILDNADISLEVRMEIDKYLKDVYDSSDKSIDSSSESNKKMRIVFIIGIILFVIVFFSYWVVNL